MKRVQPPSYDETAKQLLLLLGEELKSPLVAIAQLSELGSTDNRVGAYAKQALSTIDNVLLYQRMHSGQIALQLEPVHVGSTLQELMKQVEPIMKAAGCRTELHIQHGLSPVSVDRSVLLSGMLSLWQGFLQLVDVNEDSAVVCRAYKTPRGVRISVHNRSVGIADLKFAQSHAASSQPLASIGGAATDMLTARALFGLLGSTLNKSMNAETHGLGITLPKSKQLQMV